MIDLAASEALYYWTLDKFDDLEEHREEEGFEKAVWKCNDVPSYAITPDSVTFDRPETWDAGPPVKLKLDADGLYYQSSDGLTHEGARADKATHVVMTGKWGQDGFSKGVFVAVFPVKQHLHQNGKR